MRLLENMKVKKMFIHLAIRRRVNFEDPDRPFCEGEPRAVDFVSNNSFCDVFSQPAKSFPPIFQFHTCKSATTAPTFLLDRIAASSCEAFQAGKALLYSNTSRKKSTGRYSNSLYR